VPDRQDRGRTRRPRAARGVLSGSRREGIEVESPQPAAPTPRPGRVRGVAVFAVLVIASILLLLSTFAVWVNRVALNTDVFVDTSSELIEDPAIREAIATRAVDELYASVDVEEELKKQAPKDLKSLSGVASAGLREGAYVVVGRALRQPTLQRVWAEAVRQSHETLVQVLEGNGSRVSTEGGIVTLSLRTIVLDTAERIGIRNQVEGRLPQDVGEIEILRSDELDTAQDAFQLLKTLAWFLPLLTAALLAFAIWLAVGRRRESVRGIGIAIVVVGVLGFVALDLAGNYMVHSLVSDPDSRTAAGNAWDIMSELLRSSFRWFIVVGLLFAVGAWVAGPGRRAVAVRLAIAPLLRQRLYPYLGLAAVALILLLTAPVVDFARILTVLVFLGLLAAGIEVLRRQTLHEMPDSGALAYMEEARQRVSGWWREMRATSGPRTSPPAPAADLTSRLASLADLHARGDLTDDEFAAAKARVLAGE
jgi:hypothetical protein